MSATVNRAPGDVLVHLRRARDHVDRCYAESLDLEVMAKAAGLSKYQFHRLFAATYGVTPAAYVCRRRVERAQDLLRATNLSVTEVEEVPRRGPRLRRGRGHHPGRLPLVHRAPPQPAELQVHLALPGPPHSPEMVEHKEYTHADFEDFTG